MLYSYRTIRHQQLFYSLGLFPSSLQDVEGVEEYFNNHDCYSYQLIWRGSVLDLYTQLFAGSEKSFGEHAPSVFVIAPPPFPSPSPNKLTLLPHCYWETKICAYVNCLIYCTDCWNSRTLWGKMFPSHKKITLLLVFICKVLLRRTSSAPLWKTINK